MFKLLDILKSLYIGVWLNLRKWRNPSTACQCISDSGKPGVTSCEVTAKFHNPSSVCYVCPFLKQYAAGWRCSIAREAIVPRWFRWARVTSLFLLFFYLSTATGIYGIFRLNHIRVSWWDVTTIRISKITEARSNALIVKYNQAIVAEQWAQGAQILSKVYKLTPNAKYGYQLAHLWASLNQYTWCDQLLQELMIKFPEDRDIYTFTWARILMARHEFPRLQLLALREVQRNPKHLGWVRLCLDLLEQSPKTLKQITLDKSLLPLQWFIGGNYLAIQQAPKWEEYFVANAPITPESLYLTIRTLYAYHKTDLGDRLSVQYRSLLPPNLEQDLQLYNPAMPPDLHIYQLREMLLSSNALTNQTVITRLIRSPHWNSLREVAIGQRSHYSLEMLYSCVLSDIHHQIKDTAFWDEMRRRFPATTAIDLRPLYTGEDPLLFYRSTLYYPITTDTLWQFVRPN